MSAEPSLAAEFLEDLGMDLGLPGPGRKKAKLAFSYDRELTKADMAMDPPAPLAAKPLKAIRDSHHALARCLASGMSEGDASLTTGYSPGRISVLKADPQFQDLLTFYRSQAVDAVADFRARMADMGLDALAELRDRMEEKPEDFSPSLLREIVKDMADRTGHAPQRGPTSVTQVNIGLSDRIARARERVNGLADAKQASPDGNPYSPQASLEGGSGLDTGPLIEGNVN